MAHLRSCLLLAGAVVALVCTLPGEKPPTDPRFTSPALTVRAFWRAVLEESPDAALECFVGPGAGSGAGRLRLPALDAMELRAVRVKALGTGRALVQYQVHYRARGARHGGAFAAADEVVRVRGQWRILRPMEPGPEQARPPQPPRPAVHVQPGPEFA